MSITFHASIGARMKVRKKISGIMDRIIPNEKKHIDTYRYICGFHKWGVPPNRWLIMENTIKMR